MCEKIVGQLRQNKDVYKGFLKAQCKIIYTFYHLQLKMCTNNWLLSLFADFTLKLLIQNQNSCTNDSTFCACTTCHTQETMSKWGQP